MRSGQLRPPEAEGASLNRSPASTSSLRNPHRNRPQNPAKAKPPNLGDAQTPKELNDHGNGTEAHPNRPGEHEGHRRGRRRHLVGAPDRDSDGSPYRSPTGTESLRAAVKSDDTLNGSVTWAEVVRSGQAQRGADQGQEKFWEFSSQFEIDIIKNIA